MINIHIWSLFSANFGNFTPKPKRCMRCICIYGTWRMYIEWLEHNRNLHAEKIMLGKVHISNIFARQSKWDIDFDFNNRLRPQILLRNFSAWILCLLMLLMLLSAGLISPAACEWKWAYMTPMRSRRVCVCACVCARLCMMEMNTANRQIYSTKYFVRTWND